ncbi:MAG: DUF3859 domain-containing protein [Rhodobacteraceae bacterium]|jgi:hypothetical protein|nr:DUF3859 domain-containing protein [Paracoccaceae bacterium]
MRLLLALVMMLVTAAPARPMDPVIGPMMADVQFGVFCALTPTGRAAAPGTLSGWIHQIDGPFAFDWPGQNRVPARIGIAFGVIATAAPDGFVADAEIRVFRPGATTPETWQSSFGDQEPSLAFFRFDRPDELIPGRWAFEASQAGNRLYRVEFEVLPPAESAGVAAACGAVS